MRMGKCGWENADDKMRKDAKKVIKENKNKNLKQSVILFYFFRCGLVS